MIHVRKSFNSANFRSSSGEAVTTYWIGLLFRSRLSSDTQATHENCGERRLLFAKSCLAQDDVAALRLLAGVF
jgi:hypothetical protein